MGNRNGIHNFSVVGQTVSFPDRSYLVPMEIKVDSMYGQDRSTRMEFMFY